MLGIGGGGGEEFICEGHQHESVGKIIAELQRASQMIAEGRKAGHSTQDIERFYFLGLLPTVYKYTKGIYCLLGF